LGTDILGRDVVYRTLKGVRVALLIGGLTSFVVIPIALLFGVTAGYYGRLGFGFLEQVYMAALERELRARGHAVGREVWVPVRYKAEEISRQRIDMVVDERLVIEAGPRVQAEDQSVIRLAREFIETIVPGLNETPDPDAQLNQIVSDLRRLRHVSITRQNDTSKARPNPLSPDDNSDARSPPSWFVALVHPAKTAVTVPITIAAIRQAQPSGLMMSPFRFNRCGNSGLPVSEIFGNSAARRLQFARVELRPPQDPTIAEREHAMKRPLFLVLSTLFLVLCDPVAQAGRICGLTGVCAEPNPTGTKPD
jgi:GxxExxY protein